MPSVSAYKPKRKTDISVEKRNAYMCKVHNYRESSHFGYGGVFGGTPPRYVRIDPSLKS